MKEFGAIVLFWPEAFPSTVTPDYGSTISRGPESSVSNWQMGKRVEKVYPLFTTLAHGHTWMNIALAGQLFPRPRTTLQELSDFVFAMFTLPTNKAVCETVWRGASRKRKSTLINILTF